MSGCPAPQPSAYLAIVRRGRGELFVGLDSSPSDPGVEVLWDRRRVERRCRVEKVTGERRAVQRRGPPPSSWRWPGVVIIEAPGPAAEPQLRRKRILVVEDDPRVREVLHEALVMAGYDVVATRDGEEALTAYAAATTDLIITDLLMPRRDGVETIRGLRRQHPDARVIAVTGARGRFNRLTAARHVGAYHTLLKPFHLSELLTAVRDTLAS
jgi:CheY-like chemotaxis protein